MYSSIFQNKQNYSPSLNYGFSLPTRQGRAFKLQLGQTNGPYLAKDVMHSNQKSTYLIAAKEVLQSHKSMANLMSILNKEEEYQSKIVYNTFKVQNWFSKCDFMTDQLKYMENQIKKTAVESSKIRVQIKKCYNRINKQNQQLQLGFLPLFKNLLKCVRDQNNQQKHVFEQRKRDLEKLSDFRNYYLDQLVKCQRGIMNLEEFLGISQKYIP